MVACATGEALRDAHVRGEAETRVRTVGTGKGSVSLVEKRVGSTKCAKEVFQKRRRSVIGSEGGTSDGQISAAAEASWDRPDGQWGHGHVRGCFRR